MGLFLVPSITFKGHLTFSLINSIFNNAMRINIIEFTLKRKYGFSWVENRIYNKSRIKWYWDGAYFLPYHRNIIVAHPLVSSVSVGTCSLIFIAYFSPALTSYIITNLKSCTNGIIAGNFSSFVKVFLISLSKERLWSNQSLLQTSFL